MAGKSKDKPKVKRPARPRNNNKTPAPAPVPANGAKISKRAASSSRKTPSASNSASKTSSTTASPAPQPASGLKREDRDASTPSSVASQEAVKEFYAHLEAASSESSRWDTDSVLGAVLEDLTDETGTPGGHDSCTPDEAVHLRHMLRQLGPQDFCRVTVDEGRYTAKKLLTAFSVRPPPFLEGSPDEAYFSMVSAAIERELSKRPKLVRYNTVDDAVGLIRKSKNIVVLTGAGISTSLGIPDFRSKGTGLYSRLEECGAVSQPEDVFEIKQFIDDPSIFYSVAKDIIAPMDRCTPTHAFIAMLQDKGKLLTNYTQNIDNLEAVAGVRPDKLIQCHGSFATATCIKCGAQTKMEEILEDARAGIPPPCPRCVEEIAGPKKRKRRAGKGKGRKRGSAGRGGFDSDSEDDDMPAPGIMKPDITFYGEEVPDAFSARLTGHDRDLVDLVIVIGTSLTVQPVSEIVRYLPAGVPQINISKTPIDHLNFDVDLMGACDVVVAELARRLGWGFEHEMIPEKQEVRVEKVQGFVSRHVFSEGAGGGE